MSSVATPHAVTVEDREAELAALQSSFDEYIESSRMLEEELDAELTKMQSKLSQASLTNATLVTQLENITPQISQLEKSLEMSQKKCSEEAEKRRAAESAADEAESLARAAQGTVDRLQDECDRALSELAYRSEELEDLRVAVEVSQERHEVSVTRLQVELKETQAALSFERRKFHQLQQQQSGGDDVSLGMSSTASALQGAASVGGGVSVGLDEKDLYIKNLEDELEMVTEQLISANGNVTGLQSKITELEMTVANSESKSVATRTLGTMATSPTNSKSPQLALAELQQQLNTATEEAGLLQKELDLTHEELVLTQQELHATEQDLREAQTSMEKTEEGYKKDLSAAQSEKESLLIKEKSAKLEVDTITNTLMEVTSKCQNLESQLNNLNRAHNERKKDLDKLLNEHHSLKKEHEELMKTSEDLKRVLTEKEEEVEAQKVALEKAKETPPSLPIPPKYENRENYVEQNGGDSTSNGQNHDPNEKVHAMQEQLDDTNAKLNRALSDLTTTNDHIASLKAQLAEQHKEHLQQQIQAQQAQRPPEPSLIEEEEEANVNDDEDETKRKLDIILKNRDFDALATIVKDLDRRSESQQDHNALLLSRILRLQGNLQVCCRVRPLGSNETNSVVEVLGETEVGCYDARSSTWKSYAFDKVWGPDAGQARVYRDVEPLALSVVDGYNSCIFAYGQTGSGKTYTMEGSNCERGISYRTIQKIFGLLERKKHQQTNAESFEFTMEVSMLEIYNEEVYDLLIDGSSASTSFEKRKTGLDIRRGADKRMEVQNLCREKVSNIRDVMRLLSQGNAARATASTNLNEHSSRSHMVLLVRVTSGTKSGIEATVQPATVAVGQLFLVDLAGSERIVKSGVEGQAMKEAQHINKSLSALGHVMEALDKKASHVPYRNSKLTYLLQDALSPGGNSKTMMVVTVCPTADSTEETTTALQFATRARRIHLGVAQRNVRSKNLEETVKSLTAEMKVLAKAKEAKEEQLVELRRSHERIQTRLNQSHQSRDRMVLEESKQMAALRKSNMDVVARFQCEKSAKDAMVKEMETVKNELRMAQQGKTRSERDKERLNTKVQELESEVASLRTNLRKANEAVSASNIRLRTSQTLQKMQQHAKASSTKALAGTSKSRKSLGSKVNGGSSGNLRVSATDGNAVFLNKPQHSPSSTTSHANGAVRARVCAILKEHDPKKLNKVDMLLDKFQGNEDSLITKLLDRYENNDNKSVSSRRSLGSRKSIGGGGSVHFGGIGPGKATEKSLPPSRLPAPVQRIASTSGNNLTAAEARSQASMARHKERMDSIRRSNSKS